MMKYFLSLVVALATFLCFDGYGLETGAGAFGKPKVLHLTLHKGCAKEMESVAKELSLDLTTWFIHDLPPYAFDGVTKGNGIYNIGHERAERIWSLHHSFFESFDIILTSDTAPLSRIFLQNAWKKPLVIWICNRFDYCDTASLDCEFPDQEYYDLFKKACFQENVKVIGYTAYEHLYARKKGIDTGTLVIKPTGKFIEETSSAIPIEVDKSETFFLPPYHNEISFMDASNVYSKLGIRNYNGRYAGAKDLEGFKAIIHLPYAWSNLALFENLYLGTPYLIPSGAFMEKLIRKENYFHSSHENEFYVSEWHDPENAKYFIYFDSWVDLAHKVKTIDFKQRREVVKQLGKENAEEMLNRWKKVFSDFEK